MINTSLELRERLGVVTKFEVGDAFDLSPHHGRFDLAYSCGVTVKLLQEQARCARYVLIQIPTRYTALTGKITDERIYTVSELKAIVQDAGLRVVSAFGYGEITVTLGQIWLRRFLPSIVWRWLQDQGYAFSIAVLGARV